MGHRVGKLPNGDRLDKEDLIKSYDNHFSGSGWWKDTNKHHVLDKAVFSEIENRKDHFVLLDMGCGEGRTINLIKRNKHAGIIGIDFSGEALKKARINNPEENIILMQGNIENVPLGDNSVDVIVSLGSHEHLDEPDFSEPRRLIKEDGIFLLVLPACEEDSKNNGRWVKKGAQSEWWYSRKRWRKIIEPFGWKCCDELLPIENAPLKYYDWWFKCLPV